MYFTTIFLLALLCLWFFDVLILFSWHIIQFIIKYNLVFKYNFSTCCQCQKNTKILNMYHDIDFYFKNSIGRFLDEILCNQIRQKIHVIGWAGVLVRRTQKPPVKQKRKKKMWMRMQNQCFMKRTPYPTTGCCVVFRFCHFYPFHPSIIFIHFIIKLLSYPFIARIDNSN